MLPLQQAYEAKDAIIEYLKATFNFKDKEVNDAFYAFIQNDKYGIAHEPYISLKTPLLLPIAMALMLWTLFLVIRFISISISLFRD